MAERRSSEINEQDEMGSSEKNSGLEDFVASQVLQQEKVSKDLDNLDVTKRDNFIARALSESRRMSLEVEKSRQKQENLHTELGEGRMAQWRNEHSAEVLQPNQPNFLDLSYQHG